MSRLKQIFDSAEGLRTYVVLARDNGSCLLCSPEFDRNAAEAVSAWIWREIAFAPAPVESVSVNVPEGQIRILSLPDILIALRANPGFDVEAFKQQLLDLDKKVRTKRSRAPAPAEAAPDEPAEAEPAPEEPAAADDLPAEEAPAEPAAEDEIPEDEKTVLRMSPFLETEPTQVRTGPPADEPDEVEAEGGEEATEQETEPPQEPPPDSHDRNLSEEDHALLLRAMSALSKAAIGELGVFVVVNTLKQELERFGSEHSLLRCFEIGRNGHISLRDQPPATDADSGNKAVAAWAASFMQRCNNIVPLFTPESCKRLLEADSEGLEAAGFTRALEEAMRRL